MTASQIKICALSGPLVVIFLALALIPLANFLPPPSPTNDAQWFYDFYANNVLGIRIAGIALMVCATMIGIFSGAVAAILKRIEGDISPWTYVYLLASCLIAVFLFLSGIFYVVLMFRPERSVELVYLMSDLAWIALVIPGPPALVQCFAMAFATLSDKRENPILPRWTAYANFWFGIVFLPGVFIGMFLTGPFAWDGILAFWLPAAFFGVYFLLFTWIIWIKLDEQALATPPPA